MTEVSADSLTSLTAEELALLQGTSHERDFGGISLRSRRLEQLQLRDLSWSRSSFGESLVREVRFVGCKFAGVDFSDASLQSVHFDQCSFSDCRFRGTRMVSVSFLQSTLAGNVWQGAELLECTLQGCQLLGESMDSTRLSLHVRGGSWREMRLSKCSIDVLGLSELVVASLRFSFCSTARLAFQFCQIERLVLLAGSCHELVMYGGSLKDLSWAEVEGGRVLISEVEQVSTLHLNDCTLGELQLEHIGELRDLYVFETKLAKLSVHRSLLEGWITHSALGPGSSIEAAVLDGFFLDGSECDGLTLRDVTIQLGLCARRARFTALRLQDIHYAEDVAIVLSDASFEHSDRFDGRSA